MLLSSLSPTTSLCRGLIIAVASLIHLSTLISPATAQQMCSGQERPGATLLFPYFELPASPSPDPEPSLSLISISNTSAEPVLTNVVVWSHCGHAVFAFNLFLDAMATRPLNLQQVLLQGQIPETGPANPGAQPFIGCGSPLDRPLLDEEALAKIYARLSGQPDPSSGECYPERPAPSKPIVGYVTVDVVDRCSGIVRTPEDDGYFGDTGIASGNNVLTGDAFLIDREGNAAQGFEAVSVVAGALPSSGDSFYFEGDDRLPLPSQYRGRFLTGGSFDGGTDVVLWRHPSSLIRPVRSTCKFACEASSHGAKVTLDLFTEDGSPLTETHVLLRTSVTRLTFGALDLDVDADFGSFRSATTECRGACQPPLQEPLQSLLLPVYTAEGRFSASLKPVSIDPDCLP